MQILTYVLFAMAAMTAGYFARTRDLLWALNFGVLQWFGLRLFCSWSTSDFPAGQTPGRWWSSSAPPPGVSVHWSVWYLIVPLTGWLGGLRILTAKLRLYPVRRFDV
jgi:hypothetical protein